MKAHYDLGGYKVAVWLFVALAISIGLNIGFVVALVSTPKGLHRNCSSFGSYLDAVDSYRQGNTQLDANNNGVPCENLLKGS